MTETPAHKSSPVVQFMDQLLLSPVRTEDPSEANLFYIPSFTYSYSGDHVLDSL